MFVYSVTLFILKNLFFLINTCIIYGLNEVNEELSGHVKDLSCCDEPRENYSNFFDDLNSAERLSRQSVLSADLFVSCVVSRFFGG